MERYKHSKLDVHSWRVETSGPFKNTIVIVTYKSPPQVLYYRFTEATSTDLVCSSLYYDAIIEFLLSRAACICWNSEATLHPRGWFYTRNPLSGEGIWRSRSASALWPS